MSTMPTARPAPVRPAPRRRSEPIWAAPICPAGRTRRSRTTARVLPSRSRASRPSGVSQPVRTCPPERERDGLERARRRPGPFGPALVPQDEDADPAVGLQPLFDVRPDERPRRPGRGREGRRSQGHGREESADGAEGRHATSRNLSPGVRRRRERRHRLSRDECRRPIESHRDSLSGAAPGRGGGGGRLRRRPPRPGARRRRRLRGRPRRAVGAAGFRTVVLLGRHLSLLHREREARDARSSGGSSTAGRTSRRAVLRSGTSRGTAISSSGGPARAASLAAYGDTDGLLVGGAPVRVRPRRPGEHAGTSLTGSGASSRRTRSRARRSTLIPGPLARAIVTGRRRGSIARTSGTSASFRRRSCGRGGTGARGRVRRAPRRPLPRRDALRGGGRRHAASFPRGSRSAGTRRSARTASSGSWRSRPPRRAVSDARSRA